MKLSELLFELTGKDVKEVKTGVECEYLAALGAFFKMLRGEVLEFDLGVVDRISEVYISHMLTKGCYEFTETDRIKKVNYNDRMFFCYYDGILDVVFSKEEDWIFDAHAKGSGSGNVNMNMNVVQAKGFVALLAYFALVRYEDGLDCRLNFKTWFADPMSYLSIIMLRDYGNKLVDNLFIIENCEIGAQIQWYAYVGIQKQFGYMNKYSDSTAKKKWLVENGVEVGDPVLLYKLGDGKNNKTRPLTGCKIAVIMAIGDYGVQYEEIDGNELVLTQIERVSHNSSSIRDDYSSFHKSITDTSYTSVAFENLLFNEDYLIMRPIPDDGSCQVMIVPDDDGTWAIRHVQLDSLETIYAILENRGIEYNREKFLNTYFKNRVPYYERYRKHQPVRYEGLSYSDLLKKYGEGAE